MPVFLVGHITKDGQIAGPKILEHMVDVLAEGKADAVLAASIFHFGEYTVGDVKDFLAKHGVTVRKEPELTDA